MYIGYVRIVYVYVSIRNRSEKNVTLAHVNLVEDYNFFAECRACIIGMYGLNILYCSTKPLLT